MTDYLHSLTNWIDHNRGLVLSLILATSTTLWVTACEAFTLSPSGSGQKVNWIQLAAEVDAFEARVLAAETDLRNQDEIKAKFVEISSGIATSVIGGTFNPTQLISSLVGVAGVAGSAGLFYDNRRKDKVIRTKSGNA